MVEEQVDARARYDERESFQELGRLETDRLGAVAPRPAEAQQDFAVRGPLQRGLRGKGRRLEIVESVLYGETS